MRRVFTVPAHEDAKPNSKPDALGIEARFTVVVYYEPTSSLMSMANSRCPGSFGVRQTDKNVDRLGAWARTIKL
jgi:hypothetical protein